jgi:uncharacterized protein YcbX
MATLTQINVYPIKSMLGFQLSSAYIDSTGLAHDRQMMLIDDNGKFITARRLPRLLAFKCVLHQTGVIITNNHGQSLKVQTTDFSQHVSVNIWRHDMLASVANDKINQWISDALGLSVRLVTLNENSQRTVDQSVQPLAFSDGYPLLIIGEASLETLNHKASEPSLMSQFRSNLIFSGGDGFVEDTWRRVKIGEVEFEFVKPCERCVMTTVDMTSLTFRKSKEPLSTLATFRADKRGRLMFGENLIAMNEGVINVGDAIEVLETHTSLDYGAKR